MRTRPVLALAVLSGLILGAYLGYIPPAGASRNSSGTYSLPAGNPVVSGTTITSSHMNNTLGDVATELTNSLDRNGRGAMLAPLQLSNGTSAAPALCFGSDLDTGLYRAGANDTRMQVDATQSQKWTSTGTTIPGTLGVTGASTLTGAVTAQAGATVTNSTTNGNGIASTGNGTGAGISATGGGTSAAGGVFTGGASNGNGVTATGSGIGAGLAGFGGNAGAGVIGTGGGTAEGGKFSNGTAATGGTRQDAATLSNGDLNLSGVADPTSTTAISDRLTPKNIVKAWAKFTTAGVGSSSVAINDAFNVSGVAEIVGGTIIQVTLASAFANTNYAVFVTSYERTLSCDAHQASTTTIDIKCLNIGGSSVPFGDFDFDSGLSSSITIDVLAIGAQ